ncbi:MAG: hypothetical protein Q8O19_02715 [Rectinemataceae bacterium]|nr:hypothetical protein [Rectinemataceae bacterium]
MRRHLDAGLLLFLGRVGMLGRSMVAGVIHSGIREKCGEWRQT